MRVTERINKSRNDCSLLYGISLHRTSAAIVGKYTCDWPACCTIVGVKLYPRIRGAEGEGTERLQQLPVSPTSLANPPTADFRFVLKSNPTSMTMMTTYCRAPCAIFWDATIFCNNFAR
jgi:hypothetical protein